MGLFKRLFGRGPGSWEYPATQIGERELSVGDMGQTKLIRMKPYYENKGIVGGVTLLQALHDVKTSAIRHKNRSLPSSFEMWFHDGKVKFYLTAPTADKSDKWRRRVSSAYQNANVFEVQGGEAFPRIGADDYVSGVTLSLEKSYYFPIRTYEEGFEHDPFAEVTSEMLSDEETSVVVQVTFKAAKENWSADTADIAEGLRQGEVVGWLNPRVRDPSAKDKEAAKIVEQQRGRYGFHTNIRIMAASPDPEEAQARARGTAAMFVRYYNSATEQGFDSSPVPAKKMGKHIDAMQNREYTGGDMLLCVDALAGVAHLPSDIGTPLIDRTMSREGESAPAELERSGIDTGRDQRAAYDAVDRSGDGAEAGAGGGDPTDYDLERARFDSENYDY